MGFLDYAVFGEQGIALRTVTPEDGSSVESKV